MTALTVMGFLGGIFSKLAEWQPAAFRSAASLGLTRPVDARLVVARRVGGAAFGPSLARTLRAPAFWTSVNKISSFSAL